MSAQIKYVDPGKSEVYLATPHISVHGNVCGGWHKYSLLCDCLWLSSPLRRPENKGLQSTGVVETAVLERVPTSTRESFMFFNKCFLMLPLNPTCVSFFAIHISRLSAFQASFWSISEPKGNQHGGNFTTTRSISSFLGKLCYQMAFRLTLQGHIRSIISRSPFWLL